MVMRRGGVPRDRLYSPLSLRIIYPASPGLPADSSLFNLSGVRAPALQISSRKWLLTLFSACIYICVCVSTYSMLMRSARARLYGSLIFLLWLQQGDEGPRVQCTMSAELCMGARGAPLLARCSSFPIKFSRKVAIIVRLNLFLRG